MKVGSELKKMHYISDESKVLQSYSHMYLSNAKISGVQTSTYLVVRTDLVTTFRYCCYAVE